MVIPLLLQGVLASQEPTPTFGVSVVDSAGLQGRVYLLREGSDKLPDFEKMKSVGAIYTSSLNVPMQRWLTGFPGVTNRFDWFAIDYQGNFWISRPGLYNFSLTSDDGSRLWIDGQLIIDNDGIHPPVTRAGSIRLEHGRHRLRVAYFQGPPQSLGLVLLVAGPNEKLRVFSTKEFKPPSDLDEEHDSAGTAIAARIMPLKPGLSESLYSSPGKLTGSIPADTVNIPASKVLKQFLGPRGADQAFIISYTGSFWISEPGLYQFALRADDGARLSIDGQLIGDDSPQRDYDSLGITKYASLHLCSGGHSIEMVYVHSSSERPKLSFEIARPGQKLRVFRLQDFSPPAGVSVSGCKN
jgi:hypothetical protein